MNYTIGDGMVALALAGAWLVGNLICVLPRLTLGGLAFGGSVWLARLSSPYFFVTLENYPVYGCFHLRPRYRLLFGS